MTEDKNNVSLEDKALANNNYDKKILKMLNPILYCNNSLNPQPPLNFEDHILRLEEIISPDIKLKRWEENIKASLYSTSDSNTELHYDINLVLENKGRRKTYNRKFISPITLYEHWLKYFLNAINTSDIFTDPTRINQKDLKSITSELSIRKEYDEKDNICSGAVCNPLRTIIETKNNDKIILENIVNWDGFIVKNSVINDKISVEYNGKKKELEDDYLIGSHFGIFNFLEPTRYLNAKSEKLFVDGKREDDTTKYLDNMLSKYLSKLNIEEIKNIIIKECKLSDDDIKPLPNGTKDISKIENKLTKIEGGSIHIEKTNKSLRVSGIIPMFYSLRKNGLYESYYKIKPLVKPLEDIRTELLKKINKENISQIEKYKPPPVGMFQ